MRLKLFALGLGSIIPLLFVAPGPTLAQDADPTEAGAEAMGDLESGLNDALGDASEGIDDVFDTIGDISAGDLSDGITPPINPGGGGIGNIGGIGGIFDGIGDFIGGLPGVASEFLEGFLGDFGVPDLQEVDLAIEEENQSGGNGSEVTALAQAIESSSGGNGNGDDGGRYSVARDQSHEAQRDAAVGLAQSSTLNEDAQSRMQERAEQSQQSLEGSQEAAARSAESDVSQDILRNLSEQSSQAAELGAQQVAEAQQARMDRAMSNMIAAQQARALDQQNISERRDRISETNQSTRQTGMVVMPGGFYLGSDGSDEGGTGNPDMPQP